MVPEPVQGQTTDDLKKYLDAGIPAQGITWMIRPPPGTVGKFPVKVIAEGHSPVTADIVLGAEFPPGNLVAKGRHDSPIRELRVVYPASGQKPIFWEPLARLGAHDHIPFAKALSAMDVGWLWLYILTYLPVLFISRALLKVA